MYDSPETIQADLDDWPNTTVEGAHNSRYCFGKTPMQTWLDSKEASKKKNRPLYSKDQV
jgi:hypothetical protein